MTKAEEFLKTSFEQANALLDGNKVMGSPICLENGRIVIPITSIKVCQMSGGSEYASKNSESLPFGGISGGNFMMEPRGFLVIDNTGVRCISLNDRSTLEKILLEDLPRLYHETFKK